MNLEINVVEAAAKIAEEKVRIILGTTDIYEDDGNGGQVFTEKAQEIFNRYYEEAMDDLISTKVESYQEQAIRTESNDFEAIAKRLSDHRTIRMLHSAIGLATEAAEALDMLKKHIYYGKPLDIANFGEEIGDAQWYAAIGADAIGIPLTHIQDTNILKLRARYPEKFTEDKAENRDLNKERLILEEGVKHE